MVCTHVTTLSIIQAVKKEMTKECGQGDFEKSVTVFTTSTAPPTPSGEEYPAGEGMPIPLNDVVGDAGDASTSNHDGQVSLVFVRRTQKEAKPCYHQSSNCVSQTRARCFTRISGLILTTSMQKRGGTSIVSNRSTDVKGKKKGQSATAILTGVSGDGLLGDG